MSAFDEFSAAILAAVREDHREKVRDALKRAQEQRLTGHAGSVAAAHELLACVRGELDHYREVEAVLVAALGGSESEKQ